MDREKYLGDLDSSSPAIEWSYAFDGAAAEFVDHYRGALPRLGWAEAAAGNIPGQLANFVTTVSGRRYLLYLFAPIEPNEHFTVTVSPAGQD